MMFGDPTLHVEGSLGWRLKDYSLPEGILLRAPSRKLFADFDASALQAAAELVLRTPEKAGIVSAAVRSVAGLDRQPPPPEPLIIEAHIDALSVPQHVANELMAAGFEIDGFHRFMPRRFREHYTIKVKLARRDVERRAQLWEQVQTAVDQAKTILQEAGIESYIEVETYTQTCRRFWADREMSVGWDFAFPLGAGQLVNVAPPCSKLEAEFASLPLEAVKRADIHVKITRHGANDRHRVELISRLVEAGFYHVVTWSPNDVCTAQFSRLSDARAVFLRLNRFFERFGGCLEQTLEFAPEMWRTTHETPTGQRLCELPPLVVSLR